MRGRLQLLSLAVFLTGAAAAAFSIRPDGEDQAELIGEETLVVPSEHNDYYKPDIRFRLTLPSAFLHQKGETWQAPRYEVSFAINLADLSATGVAPTESQSVVVVTLSVVPPDAIDSGLNRQNPRYIGDSREVWRHPPARRYGLNYISNLEYPGAPPTEYLFGDGPPYRTEVRCRPSGNAYPSLCTLSVVGQPGGAIKADSNAAVMTDIVFRQERLPEWQQIQHRVEAFLNGKVSVIEWAK